MVTWVREILKRDQFGNWSLVTLEIDDDDLDFLDSLDLNSFESVDDIRIDGISVGTNIPLMTAGIMGTATGAVTGRFFDIGADRYYFSQDEARTSLAFATGGVTSFQTLTSPSNTRYASEDFRDKDATFYHGVALQIDDFGNITTAKARIWDDDPFFQTTDAATGTQNRETGNEASATFRSSFGEYSIDVNTDDLDPSGPTGKNLVRGTLDYDTATEKGLTAEALRFRVFSTVDGAFYLPFSEGGKLSFNPDDVVTINGFTLSTTEVTETPYEFWGGLTTALDTFNGTVGVDTITADDSDDTIRGFDGEDTIFGLGGADTIDGDLKADVIFGGRGADSIFGDFGDDIIWGGADDDRLFGGANNDIIHGGEGRDTIDGGSNIDTIYGGTGQDSITGGGQPDLIYGGAQSDVLSGGGGDDTIFGDDAGDTINGDPGADTIDGGSGFDTLRYVDSAAGISISMPSGVHTGGDAQGDLISGIEYIEGSTLADRIVIGNGVNRASGVSGDDTMIGTAASERLFGGSDNDKLYGGGGFDTLYGGQGDDRINGAAGADLVYGDDGLDIIKTFAGNDTAYGGTTGDTILTGIGDDTVYGDAGNDVLKASEGSDTLYGGDDDDFLSGWRDVDVLYGGNGSDVLRGDFAEDILEGGPGDNDRLLGGPDRDTFVFRDGFDEDRVLDFNPFLEKLDFSNHSGASSFADLVVTQVATNTVVTFVNPAITDRLVLADTDAARISASDFIF